MKLQIAFDLLNSEEVLAALEELHDLVDIVEIGTPLILKEGLNAVTKVKARYPDQVVLADLKIMDAGKLETTLGLAAGADIVTVLGAAEPRTIRDAVETAQAAGKQVMVDLIGVRNIPEVLGRITPLGTDCFCVHTANDLAKTGASPLDDLRQLRSCAQDGTVAIAGGLTPSRIEDLKMHRPDIVVVGGYITFAKQKREAALKVLEHMRAP